jgi:hypothetical protein
MCNQKQFDHKMAKHRQTSEVERDVDKCRPKDHKRWSRPSFCGVSGYEPNRPFCGLSRRNFSQEYCCASPVVIKRNTTTRMLIFTLEQATRLLSKEGSGFPVNMSLQVSKESTFPNTSQACDLLANLPRWKKIPCSHHHPLA